MSCLVFHHLPRENKQQILAEMFRVLKPGGKLFIADWGLERNNFKSKLVKCIKYNKPLENSLDNALGLLPGYIAASGFSNVEELAYIKTITGTLSYYKAEKK